MPRHTWVAIRLGFAGGFLGIIVGILGVWLWPVGEPETVLVPVIKGFAGLSLKASLLISFALLGLVGSALGKVNADISSLLMLAGGFCGFLLLEAMWIFPSVLLISGGFLIGASQRLQNVKS